MIVDLTDHFQNLSFLDVSNISLSLSTFILIKAIQFRSQYNVTTKRRVSAGNIFDHENPIDRKRGLFICLLVFARISSCIKFWIEMWRMMGRNNREIVDSKSSD